MNIIWIGTKYIVTNMIIGTIIKEMMIIPIKTLGKIAYNKAVNKFKTYHHFDDPI